METNQENPLEVQNHDELSDDELNAVAGGNDLRSLRLQNAIQNEKGTFAILSNIMKLKGESSTSSNIINNMK